MATLSKTDLDKLKKEYVESGARVFWSKEEKDLLRQLIGSGIVSGKFIKVKFFPTRTVVAVTRMVEAVRSEMGNV